LIPTMTRLAVAALCGRCPRRNISAGTVRTDPRRSNRPG
jgi:hypothetical protein